MTIIDDLLRPVSNGKFSMCQTQSKQLSATLACPLNQLIQLESNVKLESLGWVKLSLSSNKN